MEQSIIQRRDPQLRRAPNSAGLYDVLDLILDKGIVVDAFVRVSLVGIELLTVDLRVVVASVDTYLRYAEGVERLQLYNRSGATRLPDLVGKTMKGKAIGRSVNKVTNALAGGSSDEGDEEQHAGSHEGGGIAHTLASGVRKTFGRIVDTVTGGSDDKDSGDDDGADEAEESPRHGREERGERETPRASSGNGKARRSKAAARH